MNLTPRPESGPDGTRRPAPGSGPQPGAVHPRIVAGTRAFAGVAGTPPALHLAVSDLADLTAERPWQADRQAFGTSWQGPEEARRAALGEAVERFCNATAPDIDRVTYGSYRELRRRGRPALDPRELILYSERQYATPGFPFLPFGPDSPAHWVEGRVAGTGEPVQVPAFLVYTAWCRMPRRHPEPLYAFPAIGGIAAGPDLELALLSGLEEVIERDAVAVWWANAHPVPALQPTERLSALLGPAARDYEIRLAHLDNEFAVPVLAAGVRSRAEGWLAYGFAARADPAEAAAKALAEAFTLQITSRTLDRRAAAPAPRGRPSPLKSWRADRRYLDDYRADSSDVVELLCHQQLYLDRRAGDRVAGWAWDLPPGDWSQVPALPRRGADILLSQAGSAGRRVIVVDLTTPEARASGMSAVRVLVPGTVGAAPAAYPALGGRRLQDTAVRLGWRERPLHEHLLNNFPLPHS
ncbi:YcaO-like family protein [Kitasatospora sp. NPDC057015]|uniref:YcaO-like family protein n=1 Tax=Kitasatospora sp. NPDC057015 TaxID=3346001 RepID=UPI00362FBC30